MELDPRQVIANVEAALLAALDQRLTRERESVARDLREELDSLRAAVAQMPQVTPLLAAAGTAAPDYCQAGTFALPPAQEPGYWSHVPKFTNQSVIVDTLRMQTPSNGQFNIQIAPYQGVAPAEVVRAMSGKGLEDGRRYRYVVMAWAEDEAKSDGPAT